MKRSTFIAALCSLGLVTAYAQTPANNVQVEGAWARATVAGQMASGAYMKITAKTHLRLVGVSTAAAGMAQVHEMKMQGSVMQMRAIKDLDLPAGQTVELKPGGYHVMLMDLTAPLQKGDKLPLRLRFKDDQGHDSQLDLQVPIVTEPPAPMAYSMADVRLQPPVM